MQNHRMTLAEITADKLRTIISDSDSYSPGDKLPNENELSSVLGISRTTLREAIKILIAEGYLEVKRGSGTFVADQLSQITDANFDMPSFTDMRVSLKDLYEARMIFEPEAAALACKRASDEEIEEILKLGEICQQNLRENPAGEARIASEAAFHGAILKACHNNIISRFMPMITETIEKTFALRFNLEVLGEDAYKDHILIMNFLKKRDAEGMRSAVMIHLRHAIWNEEIYY